LAWIYDTPYDPINLTTTPDDSHQATAVIPVEGGTLTATVSYILAGLNDWYHGQVNHAPRWTDEYPNKPFAWLGTSMKAFFEGN